MTEPTTEQIREWVVSRIAEWFGRAPEDVADHATLVELGADSLDTIELVMAIEMRFNIDLDDDALERTRTVGQLVALTHSAVTRPRRAS